MSGARKRGKAFLIIAFIHYGITEFIGFFAFLRIRAEFAGVQKCLQAANCSKTDSAAVSVYSFLDDLFSFPLKPVYPSEAEYGVAADMIRPFWLGFLNSLVAGAIIYSLLCLLVASLPREHYKKFRKFISGDSIKDSKFRKHLKKAPGFGMASSLEKMEKKRYGMALVIGFFHYFLNVAGARIFEIGERMGGVVDGPASKLAALFRLPLTPLIVSKDYWYAGGGSGMGKGVVMMANSLIFACLVLIILKFGKSFLKLFNWSDYDRRDLPR